MAEVTLDSLIGEVVSSSPSTLEQLQVASNKAADLAELGDALLSHFVDRCRNDGKTWAEIGEHLGVSRQAAQKRFVAEGSATFARFTDRARLAVVRANDWAVTLDHNYIGTEHLLLGLFDTNGGVSDVVLAELGLDHDEVVRAIEQLVGRGPSEVSGQQPFTPRAKKVLQAATTVGLQLGHNYVGTEHLLLALFRSEQGLAKRLLEERGADESVIRTSVLEQLAGYAAARAAGSTNAPAKKKAARRATKRRPTTRRSTKKKSARTSGKKAAKRARPRKRSD